METKNVCVYFLRDPRSNAVRYIGITHKPKLRMNDHWTQRLYSCGGIARQQKAEWLRELDHFGFRPQMDIVVSGLTRTQAISVEHYLVSQWNLNRPGELFQAQTVVFDPIKPLSEIWDKCDDRQRLAMLRFMQDRMCLVSVAS